LRGRSCLGGNDEAGAEVSTKEAREATGWLDAVGVLAPVARRSSRTTAEFQAGASEQGRSARWERSTVGP